MCQDGKYDLVLQFDDDSPNFTHGFQAGVIWEKMNSRESFQYTFNGSILELVERMPSRKKYKFIIKELGDNWYCLDAEPG